MKRLFCMLTLIIGVALAFPVFACAEAEQTQKTEKSQVLLVCDESNGRADLETLIRACGKSVDSVSEADYQKSRLSGYSALVTTINEPYLDAAKLNIPTICLGNRAGPVDGVNTEVLQGAEIKLRLGGLSQSDFAKAVTVAEMPNDGLKTFGSLERINGQKFPFAVIGAKAAYVPWYSADGLSVIMLGGLIRQYFDGAESPQGKMYVLIDEVYPFSDLNMLRESADALHDSAIPFIVRIIPVYDNLDYPAFERYTQALLYAQSKGGTIVLHDPIVREYESQREPLDMKMARAKSAFKDAGITLVDMSLPPLALTIDSIQNINSSSQNFGNLPIDTMISFKLFTSSDEMDSAIQKLNGCYLAISSYKAKFSIEDSVYVEKQPDPNFAFRTITIGKLKGFFSGANMVLLIVVGIGLGIFALLLIVGNKIYWRKFYKK